MKTQYIVVCFGDVLALAKEVETKLAEGWELSGGVAYSQCPQSHETFSRGDNVNYDIDYMFAQAMIRRVPE